ncbi:PREDICTED: barttin [Nanorana parkeri]|uniref:barttin n=1 Tax=Nanorana parkeri TaxID=125878 RepID=UPI000854620B|nr:PREDICTED: barttin [Nanorana parkeri]
MAEDKTFRYGLIVLGFFLIMIGMFIMSVDKPQIYITFCCIGVFLIFIGVTWSICQCYPKITFTPVDMEAVPLAEKSELAIPAKQWSTTPYTSSKEAERYEATLPSYEQINIKVEELGEPQGNQSVLPFPQPVLVDFSQPKLQAKVEIHRNSIGKEEHAMVEAICQSAPLACLKEDTTITTSEKTSTGSSASSLHSCEDWQQQKQDVAVQFGGPLCGDGFNLIYGPVCDGIAMIDSPLCEASQPHIEGGSLHISRHDDNNTGEEEAEETSLTRGSAQDHEADDLYYGMKDETDNLMPVFESEFEH